MKTEDVEKSEEHRVAVELKDLVYAAWKKIQDLIGSRRGRNKITKLTYLLDEAERAAEDVELELTVPK